MGFSAKKAGGKGKPSKPMLQPGAGGDAFTPMIEFLHILFLLAQAIVPWLVAFTVIYLVMAIISVIFWKKERDPRISPFWKKIGKRGQGKKN